MAVEPLPSDVTHVTAGWASSASGEVQHPTEREAKASDRRTRCDYCPAFVDGSSESGQAWLQTHIVSAHGGAP